MNPAGRLGHPIMLRGSGPRSSSCFTRSLGVKAGCHAAVVLPGWQDWPSLQRRKREAEDGTEGDVRQVPFPT